MEPFFIAGFGVEAVDGVVGGGAEVEALVGGGGEVAGVEVPHRLEAIVGGVGVPFGGAGPGLLGWAGVFGPGLGEGEF